MNDLDALRGRFSSEDQSILGIIWEHYVTHGRRMPARVLHKEGGGKTLVRPVLEQFGGSVIFRLHRDLVHPGRQIKESVEVSESEAQISLNTVEKCIRDLSSRIAYDQT